VFTRLGTITDAHLPNNSGSLAMFAAILLRVGIACG
jgi:hypothetical protein